MPCFLFVVSLLDGVLSIQLCSQNWIMNVILSNAALIYLHKVHLKNHFITRAGVIVTCEGVALSKQHDLYLVGTLPQSGISMLCPIIQMYSEYHPFCQWILGFLQELYVHVKIFFSSERDAKTQIYSLSPKVKTTNEMSFAFSPLLTPQKIIHLHPHSDSSWHEQRCPKNSQ